MAIPTLSALEDCADFSKTVKPYLAELLELPQKLASLGSAGALLDLYIDTNPLVSGLAISITFSVIFLVLSEINRNYSQVDRAWSLLPIVYIGHFATWARLAGVPTPRVNLAWAFSVIWGVRLTYNFYRKGGYRRGSEDYRWPVLRDRMHPVLMFIFNIVFVSFIQVLLLYSITMPTYQLLLSSQFEEKVMMSDLAYYGTLLTLVFIEGVSDQQQWDFQEAKREYNMTAKLPKGFTQDELDRGFIATGLWAYSRHPNFVCEQLIWFVLYQWACYTTKSLYSWAGAGSLCLIILFQGSTKFTEELSAKKYPEYKDYQTQVSMFIPMWFSPYRTPEYKPKVIRSGDSAKRQQRKASVAVPSRADSGK